LAILNLRFILPLSANLKSNELEKINNMGYFVGLPLGGAAEKDCQVRFGKNMTFQVETRAPHLPAEWALQSGIQLTWPHAGTDWTYMLDEVQECFVAIAHEIAARETLLIVTPEPDEVKKQILGRVNMENVRFLKCETNDTWARDHGAITLLDADGVSLLDFKFNGWGLKFASDKDNLITRRAVESEVMKGKYVNRLGFVLEGGSIESDGMGTLLTTSECLLSPNRNGQMNRVEIEEYLRSVFHLQRVLWLDHGYLAGDDTDSHIDTLARFCPADTIAYVQCKDADDEHYEELHRMEEQLKTFRTLKGEPYRLLAFGGGEQRTHAVTFDGTAFKDKPQAIYILSFHHFRLHRTTRNQIILIGCKLQSPPVELKVEQRYTVSIQ
jgi:agmatine/peptidylarginine deiminase